MEIARMLATPAGRILRIVLGIVIIWIGVVSPKPFGYFLEVIGLIPIVTGVLNISIIAPLFGGPMRAADLPENPDRHEPPVL